MTEVLDIPIARARVGWGARVALDPAAAPPEPEPGEEVPRIARTLALAHVMQRMIDDGEVKDQAELARMLGFTRARVTQILDLTLLAPDIQEVLLAERADVSPRRLRELAIRRSWRQQRVRWRSVP